MKEQDATAEALPQTDLTLLAVRSNTVKRGNEYAIPSTDFGFKATKTSCSIKSPEQKEALHRAETKATTSNTCPLCMTSFTARKSLLRHIRGVLRQDDGPVFRCQTCGKTCSRRDILARHEADRHGPSSKSIECPICHRRVLPRCLATHQKSERCKMACSSTEIVKYTPDGSTRPPTLDESWVKYCTLSRALHAQLDCVLLGSWLMLKAMPTGPKADDFWTGRSSTPLTDEVNKLHGHLCHAVLNALSLPDAIRSHFLLDAIAILMACTTWVDSWEAARVHKYGFIFLAEQQMLERPCTRDEFICRKPSPAFQGVVDKVVRPSDRLKYERIFNFFIRLMRASAYDTTSRLTDGYKKRLVLKDVDTHSGKLTLPLWVAYYRDRFDSIAEVAETIKTEGQS